MNDAARSSTEGPGRNLLQIRVTGEPGRIIQEFRERHDPVEATRHQPHVSLRYWPHATGPEPPGTLEAQVRHAFDRPVTVTLGRAEPLPRDKDVLAVTLAGHSGLDRAEGRLFDGSIHASAAFTREMHRTWHITCVRSIKGGSRDAVADAGRMLVLDRAWTVDTVEYLRT